MVPRISPLSPIPVMFQVSVYATSRPANSRLPTTLSAVAPSPTMARVSSPLHAEPLVYPRCVNAPPAAAAVGDDRRLGGQAHVAHPGHEMRRGQEARKSHEQSDDEKSLHSRLRQALVMRRHSIKCRRDGASARLTESQICNATLPGRALGPAKGLGVALEILGKRHVCSSLERLGLPQGDRGRG